RSQKRTVCRTGENGNASSHNPRDVRRDRGGRASRERKCARQTGRSETAEQAGLEQPQPRVFSSSSSSGEPYKVQPELGDSLQGQFDPDQRRRKNSIFKNGL